VEPQQVAHLQILHSQIENANLVVIADALVLLGFVFAFIALLKKSNQKEGAES
jgi:hypothetical protein